MADFKTCEDCVGYQFCSSYYTESEIKDVSIGGDIRNLCGWFEDKENFVEVVRCKDCKFYEKAEYDEGFKTVCRLYKRQMQENDYCSYGERKE